MQWARTNNENESFSHFHRNADFNVLIKNHFSASLFRENILNKLIEKKEAIVTISQ